MHVPSVNGCYCVVVDNLEWAIAGLRCKAMHTDAHLVIINDAAEQQAIANMLSNYNGKRFIPSRLTDKFTVHTVYHLKNH